MQKISEEKREIPVKHETDAVVAGGAAGIATALPTASNGAKPSWVRKIVIYKWIGDSTNLI